MKILIQGGLGNQLFQWSALHAALQLNTKYKYLINPIIVKGREFALGDLLTRCNHTEHSEGAKRFHSFQIQQGARIHRHFPKIPASVLNRMLSLHYEKKQHTYDYSVFPKNRFGILIGYFEHWRYVEDAWPLVKHEIYQTLEGVRPPLFEYTQPYLVMHVRRGDNLVPGKPWGNLSYRYYEAAIGRLTERGTQIPERKIILTDDLSGALDVTTFFPDAEIYGPDSLDTWQTLKVMTKATVLLAANSTLSWWGGYIASKSGSEVVFPKPYYQFREPELGNAFLHPSFKISDAEFVDSYR